MRVGLDIGSTTIKCAVLDENNSLLFSAYERHSSHIKEKTIELIKKIQEKFSDTDNIIFAISGSAGMGIADTCQIPFVQEVYAEKIAAEKCNPGTDCIIELGGEDAKIVFLTNGTEVRMNGSCAGGTGAFIDQMALLLHMSADDMDSLANKSTRTYTIASRCGVFAKSDIQPLINQGAEPGDIAASIYQAVVNQTIAGLAQGRKIQGNILYLGGPLTFSKTLQKCFDKTLHVRGKCPEHSLFYVAIGAALYANKTISLKEILKHLDTCNHLNTYRSLPPLFKDREEYLEFHNRHAKASVPQIPFSDTTGPIHIGIDSGSTTIKMTAINEKAEIVFKDYRANEGNPVPIVKETLLKLYQEHPNMTIASVTTTGYGENLIKNAFHCDYGLVETAAHYTAAKHFLPDVDFIIDIGGQDMKCFRIENGAVSDIFLNEACSSGCGSFLQTFAEALGYMPSDFAKIALFAKHPVDLGSRCTVFMNSSVKQAQKDGASIADISAGLAISVVKNALYKVIRCSSGEELGKKIVVQGGTFYNEAVLRAFENEMHIQVIRPDIAGLMGAYGAALYGLNHNSSTSTSSILTAQELQNFSQKATNIQCQGCGNHCHLTINTFNDGSRYISGNRCDRPITGKIENNSFNLYAYKRKKIEYFQTHPGNGTRGTVGIPLVLNMYELLPFWHTFFTTLGFQVRVSPVSSHELYQKGQGTIPSDTACYPAKLTHGHIEWLIEQKPDFIWYPCMSYNMDEYMGDNHYNCPIVAYYPETLTNNIHELDAIPFYMPFLDLSNRKELPKHIIPYLKERIPSLTHKQIEDALEYAYRAYDDYMEDTHKKGKEIMIEARKLHKNIIVLAGRPYHIDPEVNHGIDNLLTRYNAAVITEDSLIHEEAPFATSILNQWTYHSRLYAAAKYCTEHEDINLIQLVSFGCGLDAITTDETREILQEGGKLYTQLKIDEITNLGAVNIRIRSLFAALQEQQEKRKKED